MVSVEERLTIVESALAEFIIQSNRSLHRLEREMRDFKDEMKDFKDEMKDFKEEARRDRKSMNKQWGELANKMGTLVEDIVAPAVRPALKKYFGEAELPAMMLRVQRHVKRTGEKGEFDVVAVGEKAVYLVEVKSRPDRQLLLDFKERTLPKFRKLFPEYKKLPLVPIFASLTFPEELIELATGEGVYLLAYREWEYMDILNYEAVWEKGAN